MEHTYQLKNMYDCAPPLCWGGGECKWGSGTGLGGYCMQRAGVFCSTSS